MTFKNHIWYDILKLADIELIDSLLFMIFGDDPPCTDRVIQPLHSERTCTSSSNLRCLAALPQERSCEDSRDKGQELIKGMRQRCCELGTELVTVLRNALRVTMKAKLEDTPTSIEECLEKFVQQWQRRIEVLELNSYIGFLALFRFSLIARNLSYVKWFAKTNYHMFRSYQTVAYTRTLILYDEDNEPLHCQMAMQRFKVELRQKFLAMCLLEDVDLIALYTKYLRPTQTQLEDFFDALCRLASPTVLEHFVTSHQIQLTPKNLFDIVVNNETQHCIEFLQKHPEYITQPVLTLCLLFDRRQVHELCARVVKRNVPCITRPIDVDDQIEWLTTAYGSLVQGTTWPWYVLVYLHRHFDYNDEEQIWKTLTDSFRTFDHEAVKRLMEITTDDLPYQLDMMRMDYHNEANTSAHLSY